MNAENFLGCDFVLGDVKKCSSLIIRKVTFCNAILM